MVNDRTILSQKKGPGWRSRLLRCKEFCLKKQQEWRRFRQAQRRSVTEPPARSVCPLPVSASGSRPADDSIVPCPAPPSCQIRPAWQRSRAGARQPNSRLPISTGPLGGACRARSAIPRSLEPAGSFAQAEAALPPVAFGLRGPASAQPPHQYAGLAWPKLLNQLLPWASGDSGSPVHLAAYTSAE